MKVGIASDHAGYDLKVEIKKYLEEVKKYEVIDFGAFSSESSDYPDYAHPLAKAIEKGDFRFGISVCGSGNGINMTLNKHRNIRSALCWIPEIASLARQHNDANVCALPARFISFSEAKEIINAFFTATFEGGRHQKRVDKISEL